VRSIVGRFLEHSRVYWFQNGSEPEIYCSSADWMERNLRRRIETCFPIRDPALAQRVFDEALANYLADNTSAWELQADGSYARVEPGDAPPHSAQRTLLAELTHAGIATASTHEEPVPDAAAVPFPARKQTP
jgi:polyphosphate kinase